MELMKLGGILALTAALVLTGCAPAALEGDPDIQAKAQAYEAKVEAKLQAQAEAALEARLINVSRPADRPLRAMFAGDTLTGGYFATVQAKGFSQIVGASLGQGGAVEEVRASNHGGRVDTLGGFSKVPEGVDLAVLQIGTVETGGGMDTIAFSTAYAAGLRNLKEKSPNAGIACLSVWQSTSSNSGAYDKIIQEQCEKAGGKFISVGSVFSNPGYRGPEGLPTWAGASDTFHPNDAGHKAIANLLLERIKVS